MQFLKSYFFLLYSLFVLIHSSANAQITFAFGSCNKENLPQNYWEEIAKQNPDLWIWMGDNIYGDSYDTSVLAFKYLLLKNNFYYKNFTKSVPVIGTWDDHDYGKNDAGKNFEIKDDSKELFMRFFDISENDPMRFRGGVYDAYLFNENNITINIIMLDTRYFRDTLIADLCDGKKCYLPNYEGDILGEEQWEWLENELKNSNADVNILCSSIQVIAQEHRFEKWHNFPNARKRLLDLIATNNEVPTIIISGDRHIAEVSAMQLQGEENILYDITSSGLTHTWNNAWSEPNTYRISDLYVEKNFGVLHFNKLNQKVQIELQLFNTDGKLLYVKELF
ncbi:MAG: alkaline phosphatase family protein [Chitinophagales bacterium]|nr:alkaline phosphatase family protein [Chitinophagales bacterium]MBP9705391.1 alkaline phosphatase family protein [Chitinophagales bacterium]